MESYHWFLVGVMVAWTPGLIVLALLLSRAELSYPHHANREGSEHND